MNNLSKIYVYVTKHTMKAMITTEEEWEIRSIKRNGQEYKLNNVRFCETIINNIRDSYYEFELLNGKELVIGKCDVQDKDLLDNHRWHVNNNLVKSTYNGKPIVFARMVMNIENCAVKYVDDNDHLNLRRANLWIQKKSKLIVTKPSIIPEDSISTEKTNEEWRSLDELGHPNYSVSNLGNVMNIVRGYNLKQTIDDKGYCRVCLCTNNVKKMMFVHQLIGRTFLKDSKNGKKSIDHIDRNSKNNKLENLRWATAKEQSENSTRSSDIGLKRAVNQYSMDNEFIKYWDSITEAAKVTNIFATSITHTCRGGRKDVGGFKWKYADTDDLPGEVWKTFAYENCGPVTVSNKGRITKKYGKKTTGNPAGSYFTNDIKSLETGMYRSFPVHRLIMAAFYGENPNMVVNHKNGNGKDNRLENLEYLTQQDNVLHAIRTGLTPTGQRGGRKVLLTKLTGETVEYESMVACGKSMGITRTVVAKMCETGSMHPDGFMCCRI